MSLFNKGGQRRTIEAPCGFRCQGALREVNNKYKIHRGHCSKCLSLAVIPEPPKFSRIAGEQNGWKGCKGLNQIPDKYMSSMLIDGVQEDYLVDANNLEQAMDALSIMKRVTVSDGLIPETREGVAEQILLMRFDYPGTLRGDKGYSTADLVGMSLKKLQIIRNVMAEDLINKFERK